MYRTCFCLLTLLTVVLAATQSRDYLPKRSYYYAPPSMETSAKTMAALRRIIQGHLQRFQQADNTFALFSPRAIAQQGKAEVQLDKPKQHLQQQQQLVVAGSQNNLEYALPPNTPTPKNYAQNFLPEGQDVVPGSSYIPLRLLLIRR
ncbi:uncharacterized protein [Drosophila tropicalis]|uniref:uncharacterized protein n=1 Tax=Drosophila tropicalis TaxID=46794 RepID=UPI0035AB68D6